MTLDQAIYVRTQQLNGHWTEPTRLAEAIAVIRLRAASPEELRRADALSHAAKQAEWRAGKRVLREWVDSTDQKWSVTKSGG